MKLLVENIALFCAIFLTVNFGSPRLVAAGLSIPVFVL